MGKKSKKNKGGKKKQSNCQASNTTASATADIDNNPPSNDDDDAQPNTFSDLRQQLDEMKAILDNPPSTNNSQSSAINALSQRLEAMKDLMGELPTLDDTYGKEQSDKMKSLLERMENLGPLRSPIDRNAASLDNHRSDDNLLCHRKRDKNIYRSYCYFGWITK